MVSVCNGCSRGSPAISTASGWTPNLQFELDEFVRHKRASISRYLRSFRSRNDSACSSGRKSSACSTRRILAIPFPALLSTAAGQSIFGISLHNGRNHVNERELEPARDTVCIEVDVLRVYIRGCYATILLCA